ncbi:retroviral-like aspartic protease family protein [Sphaerospermopsis aphanizomenoides BCCUSP55]|uniref:retropepsin-like aspartic protease family protein n=1 Tax=Sphaerospermopsis aphanizomenoides TaxID=459663 RepID=UPI001903CB70|nr:retropepsin-like aspartic protease [Sphaerospermopsis aphanizomenoides]MBK1987834.1 retroviral-like aspartic protease family protein [Sphaerospermopsis aphanizomenoides BCCUSP55]
MLESFLSRAALIILSGSLAVVTVACGDNKQTAGNHESLPVGNLAAIQPPNKKPAPPSASLNSQPLEESATESSALELALDKATGGLSISQSAQSPDDWNLVASKFQDAIALMKQVQPDSPNFPFAQRKIAEYQRQIQLARQKANPRNLASPVTKPPQVVVAVPQPKPIKVQRYSTPYPTRQTQPLPPPQPVFPSSEIVAENNEVFIAPIKRRVGGTPIVEVTFNGRQRFEMIVDTGASGTVITQEIASALGVVPVGKAKANTVSSKAVEFPVGYLDSMEVGGVMVNKVPVAIAGAELETGLLGHDFFGNYDVTIKRNVVEFRPQHHSEINPAGIQLTVPTFSRGYRFVKFP